jgi:hypothetical protein
MFLNNKLKKRFFSAFLKIFGKKNQPLSLTQAALQVDYGRRGR